MKNTVVTFQEAKDKGEKLSMLTAYDYSTARLIDEAGVNAILVGDSLGMVVLGYEDTLSVTMEDMIHHSAAVARGIKDTLLITDMPFMSYQTSVYDAVVNAGRLMKEGRAQAVKLEGGKEVCPQIKAIVDASIPVCAHLGLTPQSVNAFGGFKVQGKGEAAAQKLLDDARAVEEAGAFAVVLECVPQAFSTEFGGQTIHIHIGTEAVGIHFFRFRMKDDIYTCSFAQCSIFFEVARITLQIFGWSELHRVYKNTDNDTVIFLSGCINQAFVSFMQIAHGRYESDG